MSELADHRKPKHQDAPLTATGHEKPPRVLHYLHGMTAGGVEKWLVELMRAARGSLEMDFVYRHSAGWCAEQAREMGASVLRCPLTADPVRFARSFGAILREHGPYDAVHSHIDYASGAVLRVACHRKVPVRIAHTHGIPEEPASQLRGLALRARSELVRRCLGHWLAKYPTHYLTVSNTAAAVVFGSAVGNRPLTWLPPGIDLSPFDRPLGAGLLRERLGIPNDAWVIGHVGRMCGVKNHSFLLDVAAQVMAVRPDTRVLLVGDGPLQAALRQKARDLGIADRVLFIGVRSDVPAVMRGAVDILLLPSHSEGLGRVVLEAQAAGTPSLVSEGVPQEAIVVPELVQRAPLAAGIGDWAARTANALTAGPSIEPYEALSKMRDSPYDIRTNARVLRGIYAAGGRAKR